MKKCIFLFLAIIIYSSYYYFLKKDIIFIDNICHIMERRPSWDGELKNIEEKYNVSKFTILAFINQESSFKSDAKPPFKKIWRFIPTWNRQSSSYGYSQAINSSWDLFQMQTKNKESYRDNFYDSAEFIAWYLKKSNLINKIDLNDTFNLYLSYHEGWTGYNKKSYLKKTQLINISNKIIKIKNKYKSDYNNC
jgi:hypothetical protein